ncbi:MAG: hypothetical protein HeimC3_12500 [Candidatus Heimdallarchaeota archaeon LC_3]|uniref:Uncharacterized protein n=1 Tax=Candidatus Heimdallarchaeota archaeon LC_3 TaxID=1841598 RepID=A0ACD6BA25_9ARCH|nr:MAG: hypothetical protein HeimC3_12500 [Candidatus Heimdallarchaeota archaeon LC_3]7WHF_C Chain C, Heimdallarchaeota Gelsolin domain-containing protein 2DGel [Candidatus Heimdallarchaeota archaeon LC_3]7WHF_G Chain G, Heimdallarchaeota Gelsolin domain-containing protein 2DGel [Candidatus Heimdallarchaeota archaeon LC_3]
MVKVLHVQGKKLKEVQSPYNFLNGDVYVIDDSKKPDGSDKDPVDSPKVYIWLGSKAYADDRGVGAWAAKMLDKENQAIDIDTEVEGKESAEFKTIVDFSVVEGDTPGFLKHVEVNFQDVDYEMYRVYDTDLSDGSSSDDIEIDPVPLSKNSLKSEDVFVIDGWNDIYVWIGSKSQVGEKAAGNRLARKLDTERKRTPMVYTVNEGLEPNGFFEFLEKLEQEDPKKQMKDDRTDPGTHEITQAADDNLGKEQMLGSLAKGKKIVTKEAEKDKLKKKGFFGRLFGR